MKIAVTKNQNTISHTIALNDTLRYVSQNPRDGFLTVAEWAGRGLPRENICGQGVGEFNCSMIPVPAYQFTGEMVKLTIGATFMVSNPTNYLFRWGAAIFRDDSKYIGWQPSNGIGLLDQGTFSLEFRNYATNYQEFDIPAHIPSGTSCYVYLWRYSTGYGNFHVRSNVTVTAHVSGTALAFYNATPYVYQGGEWKLATPKVYTDDQWKTGG